ncbi:DUF4132 domain-containing protein [Streptomyces sp. H27-C3]|uniref:DUF4132 domain-containing protein n=1 Tax=Streptomyces sp. H27-C3 TaxID=3046305 RepID=UPI0024BBA1B4|nr:DUF4132 domain-containing protein [Streptomyces sp. H27-C3]MDJ0465850.1 DUF4132 domain-containing protein [Streptomyces sp. H27-C3]
MTSDAQHSGERPSWLDGDTYFAPPLAPETEARVRAALRQDQEGAEPFDRDASRCAQLVAELAPAERRALARILHCAPGLGPVERLLWEPLFIHACAWEPEDVDRLFSRALCADVPDAGEHWAPLRLPLAAARELTADGVRSLHSKLCWALSAATERTGYDAALVGQAAVLLAGADGPRQVATADRLLSPLLPYARYARAMLSLGMFGDGVVDLIEHCAAVGNVRPSAQWLRRAAKLIRPIYAVDKVLNALLAPPVDATTRGYWCPGPAPLDDTGARIAMGAAWMACIAGEPRPIRLLGAIVRRLGGALPSLASNGTSDLGSLAAEPDLVRAAYAALSALAAGDGTLPPRSPAPCQEQDRQRVLGFARSALAAIRASRSGGLAPVSDAEFTAVFTVLPHGQAAVEFRDADGCAPRDRAEIEQAVRTRQPERYAALHRHRADLGAWIDEERAELLYLWKDWASMTLPQWRERWFDDPVAGPMCRNLVWEVEYEQRPRGLLVRDPASDSYCLHDIDGRQTQLGTNQSTYLRMWPVWSEDSAVVDAYRRLLTDRAVRQPIDQLDTRH